MSAEVETAWSEAALPFLAWSHLFSPMVSSEIRAAAWEALRVPLDFEGARIDYWNTFHTGMPAPPVPLLLHAALDRPGQQVREDWLRVLGYLGLEWKDVRLPPDHLGIACEIFACAIEAGESVLTTELRSRYLAPWCDAAEARLVATGSPLVALPRLFAEDLRACT